MCKIRFEIYLECELKSIATRNSLAIGTSAKRSNVVFVFTILTEPKWEIQPNPDSEKTIVQAGDRNTSLC